MVKNRGIEHFFQHWARSTLHLLSRSISDIEMRPNNNEGEMPAIYFFLDSLSHHYMNARRTFALSEAVDYLKKYCADYPAVTKEKSQKALFLARYLYKALGLERNFAFAEAEDNDPSSIITERREAERHPIITPVRFRRKGAEIWTPSRIVNISESGLKLEADCRLGTGGLLQVEILPGAGSPFLLEVQTIWTAKAPLRPSMEYGLHLIEETASPARERLSSLIDEKLARERLAL